LGTRAEPRRLAYKGERARAMPNQHDVDRRNDKRLLTPLLLMAVIVVAGILIYSYSAHALVMSG
jgi:hypothetical protein